MHDFMQESFGDCAPIRVPRLGGAQKNHAVVYISVKTEGFSAMPFVQNALKMDLFDVMIERMDNPGKNPVNDPVSAGNTPPRSAFPRHSALI